MESGRSAWKMLETGSPTAKLMPVSNSKVLTPASGELKKRLEQLEHTQISLEREKGRLERELEDARSARDDAREQMHDLEASLSEARDERSELHREIDDMTNKVRTAESTMDEAASLSNRLTKRVSELEHMVEKRAEELANALGEFDSREALLEDLRGLSTQEATVKSELSSAETRLDEVRKAIDHDERLQRVLTEQVNAQRDRHRTGQGELDEIERRIENQRAELADLDAEGHAHRRLMEEERGRILDSERKSTIMQSELREMMEERRLLLRELGDLDARKAQSETELRMLLEQAEDIQEAHEMALLDLQEADRIRARLAEEPLAQALLGDERGLSSLEPVLVEWPMPEVGATASFCLTERLSAHFQSFNTAWTRLRRLHVTCFHLKSWNYSSDKLQKQRLQFVDSLAGRFNLDWNTNSLKHVQHVVLDLEGLLDEYERSVTMLAQLQEVLRGLVDLGLPSEDIKPLERFSHMPEALPYISVEARRLIQRSLDEIYLDADRRTAGDAVGLAETVEVLESLLRRLDVAGLTGEDPTGALWSFQRSGSLPFEIDGLARHERPDVNTEAIRHMNPVAEVEEATPASTEVIAPSAPAAAPTPEASSAPASNSTWQPIEPASKPMVSIYQHEFLQD